MKRTELNLIVKRAKTLTDEELEKEYYDAVFDSLGSQTEEMYELGYDIVDIEEREKYERYLVEKADVLENLCGVRGIKLWQNLNK